MTAVVLRYRCLKHTQMHSSCSLIWHLLVRPSPGQHGWAAPPLAFPIAHMQEPQAIERECSELNLPVKTLAAERAGLLTFETVRALASGSWRRGRK